MKKFIAYVLGLSLLAGCGYHLYRNSKNNGSGLKVVSCTLEPTSTPSPTYEPTYITYKPDGSVDCKFDINYLLDPNPTTIPEILTATYNEDGTISFQKIR